MICVDEFGPLNLQPRPGRGWFPSRSPTRLRATYHRYGRVRHMLAGLDLASGQLFYRLRDRKRWQEFLAFLRQLRRRFPTGRLYLVCDNFSPHRKAEVATARWCCTHASTARSSPAALASLAARSNATPSTVTLFGTENVASTNETASRDVVSAWVRSSPRRSGPASGSAATRPA